MQRIVPGPAWPLHDVAAIRRIEQRAAAALPPHALMQRAGLAVARLTLALAPHARTVWIAEGRFAVGLPPISALPATRTRLPRREIATL